MWISSWFESSRDCRRLFLFCLGGAIYVPVMTLVMGFTTHEATVTAQSLMFGGVLAGTLLHLPRRHVCANRPLIDLDLVSFLPL